MAQNLQLLRRRIKTAKNIAQVARSMEMISASKIKKAQTAVENNKPYAERIMNLSASILKNIDRDKFKHPYVDGNDSDKTLLIVISSDKGLCGSLNTNLTRKLLELDARNQKVFVIGKKVFQSAARLDSEYLGGINIGTVLPPYSMVYQIIELINQEYLSGKAGSVKILVNRFNSIFSQEPTIRTLLPIEVKPDEVELPYIFEPASNEIIADLLPFYLEALIYNSLLEAYTSEQAARMVAMQNAKNNAFDIADYLTLSYNKQRQEKITSELLTLSNNV